MIVYALFGIAFGFILTRVGATDYDAIVEMFLLRNMHLAGVIGAAIAVAGPAFWLLRRKGVACPDGCSVKLGPKPRKSGNAVGGLLFGIGWAITGTCPGTSLAQLGESRMMAVFTIAGILAGVAIHRKYGKAVELRLDKMLPPKNETTAEPALAKG